jgi:hypothetical protein
MPTALSIPATPQRLRFGTQADDVPDGIGSSASGDDRQADSLALQIAHHRLPETTVAADHPVTGRRIVPLRKFLPWQTGEQVDQAEPVR